MAKKKTTNSKIQGQKKTFNNNTTATKKSKTGNKKITTPKSTEGIKNIRQYVRKAIYDDKLSQYNNIIKDINRKMGVLQREGYSTVNKNYERITNFLRENRALAKMNDKGALRFRELKKPDARKLDEYLMAVHGYSKYNLSTKTMKEEHWINRIVRNIYGENATTFNRKQLGSVERVMQVAREMQFNIDDFDLLDFDSEAIAIWASNNYNKTDEEVYKRLLEISQMPEKNWISEIEKDIRNK